MGSDFVPAPRDFADQPIGNAIEAKDFKKALKLVEKRLAKKRDPYLLALKRFIQCCHPVVSERGISVAAICDLATRSEATVFSGIEELELYDEALKAAFPDSLGVEGSVICRMRAAAVKAVPKDEKLALACFNACLARDRFEQAQQIANSLQKNFPSNRVYPLWAITTMWIFAHSSEGEGTQRKVCAQLAYMQIEKLAKATIEEAGLDSTSRKLRNPQELLLLHRLIREHNLPAEERMKRGLDFHENPYVGSTSKAAKGSWELQRNHLLLLEENRSWNTLLKKCVDMLQKVGPHDGATAVDPRGADWQVWRCYLLALVETHSTANEDLVDEEFEHILGLGANLDKTYSRNAALARLELTLSSIYAPPKLTSSNSVKVKDDEKPSKIYRRNASHQVNRLAIYFDDRVSAPSLFADIKPQVEKLNLKDQRVLMLTICNMIRSPFNGALSASERVTAFATAAKMTYLMRSSMADKYRERLQDPQNQILENFPGKCQWCNESRRESCSNCLKMIASQAIHSYTWSFTKACCIVPPKGEVHPADDFLLVAAMSLIKLSGAKPEAEVQFAEKDLEIAMALIKLSGAKPEAEVQFAEKDLAIQRLLQAAALLEFGTQRSKANPKFALMLVRLYFRLGAGSLAIRAYQRLGIKQIQGDTLGYMLFDRISTLHPHPVSGSSSIEDDMDPSDQLRKMQGLYRRQREQIRTSIWRSFEHGSYDSIFQLMEVSDKLSRSTAAAMMTIELSRITRFIDPKAAQHKISLGYNTLSTDPLLQEYSDNSDYTSFPNFETSASAPFEMYTRPGPGPSSDRYRVMLLVDLLWMVVTCHPNHVTQKTCLLLDLQTSIRAVEQLLPDTMTGNCLTYPERHYIFTASKLARLVLAHFDPHSPPPGELLSHTVETVTEGVLTSRDLIDQINVDDTHYFPGFLHTLHPLYMAHDLASLIVAVSHFIKQSPYAGIRATHESSDVYQELAKQLQSRVSEKAEAIRNRLNAGSWLDFIMDQVRIEDEPTNNPRADPGSKIAVLFDEKPAFIENFAAELLDSWRESTLGLASLQSL